MAKKRKTDMNFRQVFQGDVWLMRIPDEYSLKAKTEGVMPLVNGRLRLLEGELTGHHHYVDVMDRPVTKTPYRGEEDLAGMFSDSSLGEKFQKKEPAHATLHRASAIANELVSANILMRADLVIGLLNVENGPMQVYHQEHSPVYLSPGRYVVGRQIESVAGEERRVAD